MLRDRNLFQLLRLSVNKNPLKCKQYVCFEFPFASQWHLHERTTIVKIEFANEEK